MGLELPEIDQELIDEIKKKNIDKIFQNKELKTFIEQQKLTKDYVYTNLVYFYKALECLDYCSKCPGLLKCKTRGYKVDLVYDEGNIKNDIIPCNYQKEISSIKNKYINYEGSIESLSYSLQETLQVYKDDRKELVASLARMIKTNNYKWIYLSGPTGVGKSFIMEVFSKVIAEKNRNEKIMYIDFKNWLVNLSSTSYKNTYDYDDDMDLLKNVRFLFLDNFGMERENGYIESEPIVEILKARSEANLPTFFISQINLFDLGKAYNFTSNGLSNTKVIKEIIKNNGDIFTLNTLKYPV